MAFFNVNYFNGNSTFQQLPQLPIPSTYNSIKLFGGATFDDLWLENYKRTQAQINTLDLEVEPQFTVNTLLLAHFNNNLQAGNIINLPSPIDKWIILRKGKNESKFTKIAEVGADVESYVDRKARSKEEYVYQLLPVTEDNKYGESLTANTANTDFSSIFLLDEDNVYSFCYNVNMSDISTEDDVSIQQTRGKYDTILKGNRSVSTGTLSAILTSNSITTSEIEQDTKFLEDLKSFILNGKSKILKLPKGLMYQVYTYDFSLLQKYGTDSYGNTVYSASFSWREIGDI